MRLGFTPQATLMVAVYSDTLETDPVVVLWHPEGQHDAVNVMIKVLCIRDLLRSQGKVRTFSEEKKFSLVNINALPSAAFYVSVSDYVTMQPAYRKATPVLEKRNWKVLALGYANHLGIIEANFGSSLKRDALLHATNMVPTCSPENIFISSILQSFFHVGYFHCVAFLCWNTLPDKYICLAMSIIGWIAQKQRWAKFLCEKPDTEYFIFWWQSVKLEKL